MPWTERTIPLNAVLKAPHETIIKGWYDFFALDLQCLPSGSGHGSPKRGITRLYGRIFRERFVTKNSYQPSIKIIVSCGAFKTALSGMVRSVHGTHPLRWWFTVLYINIGVYCIIVTLYIVYYKLWWLRLWSNYLESQSKYNVHISAWDSIVILTKLL